MINKSLSDLDLLKKDYENKLKTNENTDEVVKEFKENLKLYLFDANKTIKEIFGIDPSPFFKEEGYTRMFQKGGVQISKKTKIEYFKELDSLLLSSSYNILDDTKKALINNAIYVLKAYYKDSLN